MRRKLNLASAVVLLAVSCGAFTALAAQTTPTTQPFRPPAVPLLANDPYFSVWSMADRLTDAPTKHWTKHDQSLISLIRVDGSPYRLMGDDPSDVPAMPQIGVSVQPTRSIYRFENSKVHVTLTFMTAALPQDLEIFSRPVSYITWAVRSMDGRKHKIALYDSTSSQLAVNTPDEYVEWQRAKYGKLTALRMGTQDQFYLHQSGDDVRIDWGYAYAAAPSRHSQSSIGANDALLHTFLTSGKLPAKDDSRMARAVSDHQPVMAFVFPLGKVGSATVSRHVIVAYDEVWSILYFGNRLRPYWRRNGAMPATMLQAAEHDYPELVARCAQFDAELMKDMTLAGGAEYAQLTALAYRQAFAGADLAADVNGKPLYFTKENTSNGDTSTVDVIAPMSPQLLFFGSTFAKMALIPILSYAASSHWKFPNAPHDLGTYPIVEGTDTGGEQMPVEESGNILLLADAISREEGNTHFIDSWWPILTKWAGYLQQYGNDPEDQLCTDDFTGRLAHNANLAIKAILGLAAYGDMARMRGDAAAATHYRNIAKQFSAHWMRAADDGDHYRIAFDKPNTWSQKYNLVWDRVLGLNIFPASVAQKEIAYYQTKFEAYGLPLDSRGSVTEVPWSTWVATMADNPADFQNILGLIYKYSDLTTDRLPFADIYHADRLDGSWTDARPVIGAVFMKAMSNRALWNKWAAQDHQKIEGWAPLPATPPYPPTTVILPTSQTTPQLWRYATEKPDSNWTNPDYNDSGWKNGPAPFGLGARNIGTPWNSADLWMRKTIRLTADTTSRLQLYILDDAKTEVFLNGQRVLGEFGTSQVYQVKPIPLHLLPSLTPGASVTIAVHCQRWPWNPMIDLGLVQFNRTVK